MTSDRLFGDAMESSFRIGADEDYHAASNGNSSSAAAAAATSTVTAAADTEADKAAAATDPFLAIVNNPALKLRLELWKKEEEVVNQRTERKEQRLNNTKNEIYQLLGIYFVFQGVILTALAQATNLHHKNWWIPFVLSLLASLATILALWYKLGDCSELEKQVRDEKRHSKALYKASDRLKSLGASYSYAEFQLQPQLGDSSPISEKPFLKKMWDSHMKAYGAAIILILLMFSGIMAASCYLILQSSTGCGPRSRPPAAAPAP